MKNFLYIEMIIEFIDGSLNISNTTLMKIPYFTALLNVNPNIATTHLDYEKAEFLQIIKSLETPLTDYLGLQNEQERIGGFIMSEKRTDVFNPKNYYKLFGDKKLKVFGEMILKSDKGNYIFNITASGDSIDILYKNKTIYQCNLWGISSMYLSKKSDHLLSVYTSYNMIRTIEEC